MAAKIDKEKCNGCGSCIEICPVQAIKLEKEKATVTEECIDCGACVESCAQGAISLD